MNLFQDEAKIKTYAQIQEALCSLRPNASDEEIDKVVLGLRIEGGE